MKTFRCHCGNALHFENSRCLECGRTLGFLPDAGQLSALDPTADGNWKALSNGRLYRQCDNYTTYQVCNWMVPLESDSTLCISCGLNHIIPDLSEERNLQLWYRIEAAKRRLIYGLSTLGLPVSGRQQEQEGGLAFEFLADPQDSLEEFSNSVAQQRVTTGHRGGLITINLLEAEDSTRERMREKMKENYRTLLGHFRHESGHYYWDQLIAPGPWLDRFRNLFGDERSDYGAALEHYYADGPSGHWQDRYISAYASSHPWEDWAETWAHYLHMIDTLETAADFGFISIETPIAQLQQQPRPRPDLFEKLLDEWSQLSVALNALNRSMGLADAYPFSVTDHTATKLRFVHELIGSVSQRG